MGDFSPIVFVLACSMDHGREDVPMCSRITPKLVGDQLPGCLSLMFQGSTKEALSGSPSPTLADWNIDHVSILIDGPPKIEALTLDGDEEFIDVPDVAESSLFPTQSSGVGRSEFLTPVSDRFIGDKDSSLGEQVFYVSKAQGEPMVKPNSVADDFRWKAMPSIK
jgi:hypothetical protein